MNEQKGGNLNQGHILRRTDISSFDNYAHTLERNKTMRFEERKLIFVKRLIQIFQNQTLCATSNYCKFFSHAARKTKYEFSYQDWARKCIYVVYCCLWCVCESKIYSIYQIHLIQKYAVRV